MPAEEDRVEVSKDAMLSSRALIPEVFQHRYDCGGDELRHIFDRHRPKELSRDEIYAAHAFLAEMGAWYMREVLAEEFRELKNTVTDEYEELPFRSLDNDESQDAVTAACTGPAPYNYPRLLPEPSAIRLVVLLPSLEQHADIVCELCNSALSNIVSDKYEALSYVWGDPNKRRPIIVSRKLFQATENLEAALRNLRHPTQPRVLWIDAICINQNDVQERNEQVKLMGDIYRCARRVIVWLGPESDTSGAAFQLMRNKPDVPDFDNATPQEIKRFWASFVPGLLSFCRLVRRPWFKRVWCIQELALARAVDFQCGQHCASMSDFVWMKGMFSKGELFYQITVITERELRGGDNDSVREALSFFMKLAHLHTKMILTGLPGFRPDRESSHSALIILNYFQDWLCSNDKDRIFAFYGLVSAMSPDKDALRPNYSLSVDQVYIRFAVRYLQQHKDLHILITATRPLLGFVDTSTARELPSWVPDWRDASRHGTPKVHCSIGIFDAQATISDSIIVEYDTMYDACLSLQATQLEFHQDFRTLCLHGIAVDKIEETGTAYIPDGLFSFTGKSEVLKKWMDIAAPSSERRYPYTGETGHEAFWRTLQMDDQLLYIPTQDNLARMFQESKVPFTEDDVEPGPCRERIPPGTSNFLPAGEDDMQRLESLTSGYRPFIGRKFFKTAKGLFGLGPASARVADDVVVLFGGRAPFVLRPDCESHRVLGEW
ncbi:Heterokaryon incompatibility protein [Lasiodiplodia theobromae]|uniref:Heterokaryon incompatibility protein n=1 Tax=Lasiodiplodia theobromae TaxID=45133 RepID=UPI0015C2FE20|nr:Heterokaryon incompatibility protein [Lasiodiplodia theobromae]KAF4535920.1 Heterokaryon incompatibility protein [Lasiodiplodia theobromae]